MSDDTRKRGAADRARINVHEAHERRYWAHKFHVSENDLRDAVKRSGPMVRDVERELRK